MHGFGAQITGTDIVQSLAHFGPVLRFRLFQDPVSKMSLRACSLVFEDAHDAARALEAAAESQIHLAGAWAPEAYLVPDDTGEVARRAYEAVVQGPMPSLVPVPPEASRAARERAHTGAGAAGSSMDPRMLMHGQTGAHAQGGLAGTAGGAGGGGQLCISGIGGNCTPQSVKTAFDNFGRVQGFVGACVPTAPSPLLVTLGASWRWWW